MSNRTLVRNGNASESVWHIYQPDNSKDSDTHTLCGEHWFYEQTERKDWTLPMDNFCVDCGVLLAPEPPCFTALLADELARARQGHPGINSHHEGYAVILEEVEEYWQEVKKKSSQRNPSYMLDELVQIAAMCQRTAEDLGLVMRAE